MICLVPRWKLPCPCQLQLGTTLLFRMRRNPDLSLIPAPVKLFARSPIFQIILPELGLNLSLDFSASGTTMLFQAEAGRGKEASTWAPDKSLLRLVTKKVMAKVVDLPTCMGTAPETYSPVTDKSNLEASFNSTSLALVALLISSE